MQRRSFLGGIFAAGFAPAYVGASVLMPVKKLAEPLNLIVPPQTLAASMGRIMFDAPLPVVTGDNVLVTSAAYGGLVKIMNAAGITLGTFSLPAGFTGFARGVEFDIGRPEAGLKLVY